MNLHAYVAWGTGLASAFIFANVMDFKPFVISHVQNHWKKYMVAAWLLGFIFIIEMIRIVGEGMGIE